MLKIWYAGRVVLHLAKRRLSSKPCKLKMAFRRAAGALALRAARSSRSYNTVSKSVAAAVEVPACSAAKPQVHLSRCFSAAAEPAPAPSAVKGYVTQVDLVHSFNFSIAKFVYDLGVLIVTR